MRLFSYVVATDSGFAPNPFWGFCTLADCKPAIRRTARVGDWIAGLTPKASGNQLVYAMRVDEVMPFAAYFTDGRFERKKPDYARQGAVWRRGDNIYQPLPDGGFRQLQSGHSNGVHENPESKAHDLAGLNVLVAEEFYYFGSDPLELPPDLHVLKVGRAHKNRFPPEVVDAFLRLVRSHPKGVLARPHRWPEGDESWRPAG